MRITDPTPEHHHITEVLKKLVQSHDGVLVLTLTTDGRIHVISGAVDIDAYRDLIAEAPSAVKEWASEALGGLGEMEQPAMQKELN